MADHKGPADVGPRQRQGCSLADLIGWSRAAAGWSRFLRQSHVDRDEAVILFAGVEFNLVPGRQRLVSGGELEVNVQAANMDAVWQAVLSQDVAEALAERMHLPSQCSFFRVVGHGAVPQ